MDEGVGILSFFAMRDYVGMCMGVRIYARAHAYAHLQHTDACTCVYTRMGAHTRAHIWMLV